MTKYYQPIILGMLFAFSTVLFTEGAPEAKGGLTYEDLTVGDGAEVVSGTTAYIQLVMWMDVNGVKGDLLFDSHLGGNKPISFVVGTERIPAGLNIGVTGMRAGGKRLVHVPADLNPEKASGFFPGNTNLIFEIELIDVK